MEKRGRAVVPGARLGGGLDYLGAIITDIYDLLGAREQSEMRAFFFLSLMLITPGTLSLVKRICDLRHTVEFIIFER